MDERETGEMWFHSKGEDKDSDADVLPFLAAMFVNEKAQAPSAIVNLMRPDRDSN